MAVDVQSHIVVGEHRSRGDLPVIFSWNGHILGYVSLADRFALSGLAALARSSSFPFVPMTLSKPANTPRTIISFCCSPHRYAAPRHLERPLRPASGFRIGFALLKVESVVRRVERYHNLKASADHRLASCAAMQGFQPLCFAPMVFRTAPSCTCTTLCLCRHQLLLLFRSRFDPAGFPFAKFYFTPQSYGIPRNSKGRFALRVLRRFASLQRRNHPCFCGNPLTMPFCGSVKFKILSK